MIRSRNAVAVPDCHGGLPAHLPPGTRVRLGWSRTLGTVERRMPYAGGVCVAVRIDRTGKLRYMRPEQLAIVRDQRPYNRRGL